MILYSVFIFIIIFLLSYWWINNPKNLPPGPWGLPIIGNILEFRKREIIGQHLTQIGKRYGDIYSLYVGRQYFIVLNGFEKIKEAFVNRGNEILDRPNQAPLFIELSQKKGIIAATGSEWKEQRRFALHILRDLGLGKTVIEERIEEEARILICNIEVLNSEPFNPTVVIQNSVANVICSIVFGHRFEFDDERFQKILIFVKEIAGRFSPILLIKYPHLLKYIGISSAEIVLKADKELKVFLKEEIEEHEATLDPNSIRDYIDAYLNEKHRREEDGEPGSFQEISLIISVRDLFIAGSETTANTLCWSILYMLIYPDVQKKVQQELDSVVGRDRMPTISDINQCHYVQATMHEILRFACILNFIVPHCPTGKQTIDLLGYQIPGESIILGNIYSVMRDPKLWKKTDTFYPENFLDGNGRFSKPDWFIPFGLGPRVCLGEKLAKTELYIFLPYLLHQFCFEKVDGTTYTTANAGGIVSQTAPYKVRAIRRC